MTRVVVGGIIVELGHLPFLYSSIEPFSFNLVGQLPFVCVTSLSTVRFGELSCLEQNISLFSVNWL